TPAAVTAARSPRRSSCNASSTARRGRISISRERRWARRKPKSTTAGVRATGSGCWSGWSPTITRRKNSETGMTEVLFYHLQDMTLENVLPPLLEKSLERGWRVVVQSSSEERADALDAHLWTYRDDSFLP